MGLLVLLAVVITACAADDEESSSAPVVTAARPGEEASGGTSREGQDTDTDDGRAIARDVTIYVTVDDVAVTSRQTISAITDAGGLIDASDIVLDPAESASARIEARVPPDQLEPVADDVAGLGDLTSRQQTAADVTSQVTDLETRIASTRASVKRVQALLDSAEKLSDVVLLEGELTKRQTELEQLAAQQLELSEQTDMAGLVVVLSRTPMEPASPGDTGIIDALGQGWDAFVSAVHFLLIALAVLLPFLITGGLVALAAIVIIRRVRRSRSDAPPPPPAPAPGP